jgi:hypothetical protein
MKIKICFIVETTYSMASYLHDVQYSMEETLNGIRFYNPNADISVALVTYRGFNDPDQIGIRDWRSDEEFWDNWTDLKDDSLVAWFSETETADVAGGVNNAVSLDWSEANTRLVFHYGISVAHGDKFHGPDIYDRFPKGDPRGYDLLADVYTFSYMSCEYTFFRIDSRVDTMLTLMDEAYTMGGKFVVEQLEITEPYTSEPDSEEE